MRLIHTADLHIGANRSFPNYLERYQSAVNEIIRICEKARADCLILAGDLLDTTNPNIEEKKLISRLVSHAPCPVALIHGNHEMIGPNPSHTSLSWLLELAPRLNNVKIWSEPTLEKWLDVWWLAIPPQKTVSGKWNTTDFHFMVKHFLSSIPKEDSSPIIGVAHEFFDGAILENGHKIDKGLTNLPKSRRVCYWALGDIHKSNQQISHNAWYCGSPLQQNFGEKRPKGVLQVDLGQSPKFIELKTPLPLLNLTKIPKNNRWPEGFIKLEIDLASLPSTLPDNVVSIVQVSTDSKSFQETAGIKDLNSRITTETLIKELEDLLIEQDLEEKIVKRAVKLTQKLVGG